MVGRGHKKGEFHHTEESKKKIGLASKGRIVPLELRKKISNTLKGHPIYKSKERSANISKAMKGKLKKPLKHCIDCNKILGHRRITRCRLCHNRRIRKYLILPFKDTKPEVKIQTYLKMLGIDFFTHQYMNEIKHSYQCDILVPSLNMIIECDGDYWHKYPVGLEKDHIRTKELIAKGFKVIRLWEHEINAMQSPKELLERWTD